MHFPKLRYRVHAQKYKPLLVILTRVNILITESYHANYFRQYTFIKDLRNILTLVACEQRPILKEHTPFFGFVGCPLQYIQLHLPHLGKHLL